MRSDIARTSQHKLRPAAFPRLAKELEEQATIFLRDVLPQRTEAQVDVKGVLRQVMMWARGMHERWYASAADLVCRARG